MWNDVADLPGTLLTIRSYCEWSVRSSWPSSLRLRGRDGACHWEHWDTQTEVLKRPYKQYLLFGRLQERHLPCIRTSGSHGFQGTVILNVIFHAREIVSGKNLKDLRERCLKFDISHICDTQNRLSVCEWIWGGRPPQMFWFLNANYNCLHICFVLWLHSL